MLMGFFFLQVTKEEGEAALLLDIYANWSSEIAVLW